MNYIAPVIIATLNRHIHFIRCVEPLDLCIHANNTALFISLNSPLNESYCDGYKGIKALLVLFKCNILYRVQSRLRA